MSDKDQTPDAQSSDANDDSKLAAEQINSFVESDRVKTLLEALDHHLAGEIDRDTYEEIGGAGILLVGDAGFGAIVWVADGDSHEKIEMLDLSPVAKDLVTKICALYGSRLKQAYKLSEVFENKADDWESFGRRAYRIITGDGYRVETEIIKFNGETFTLSAGLPSAVRLAVQTLKTLLIINDFDSLEERDQTRLKEMLEEVSAGLKVSTSSTTETNSP